MLAYTLVFKPCFKVIDEYSGISSIFVFGLSLLNQKNY